MWLHGCVQLSANDNSLHYMVYFGRLLTHPDVSERRWDDLKGIKDSVPLVQPVVKLKVIPRQHRAVQAVDCGGGVHMAVFLLMAGWRPGRLLAAQTSLLHCHGPVLARGRVKQWDPTGDCGTVERGPQFLVVGIS